MAGRNFRLLQISFMILFWNGLWSLIKSTTSLYKKKKKNNNNKKVTNAILKQNTCKNNKKKLFQKHTNLIEMLNLITRPNFPTIIIHNSYQKKGKCGLLNWFVRSQVAWLLSKGSTYNHAKNKHLYCLSYVQV